MGRRGRFAAGIILIGALALVAGACKRNEQPAERATTAPSDAVPEAGPSSGARLVEVSLTDQAIEIEGSLPPGPTVFRIRNTAKRPRALIFEGNGATMRVPGMIQPGEMAQLEAILQPGLYSLSSPNREQPVLPQQFLVTERARLP